jgi:hypothetical protein
MTSLSGIKSMNWKERQEIYHKVFKPSDFTQYHQDVTIDPNATSLDIVAYCEQYFVQNDLPLVYPHKTYAVAAIYATLLAKYFGGTVVDLLDDPDLLYGNNDFFVTYTKDQTTYDLVLSKLEYQLNHVEMCSTDNVRHTIACFFMEFLMGDRVTV